MIDWTQPVTLQQAVGTAFLSVVLLLGLLLGWYRPASGRTPRAQARPAWAHGGLRRDQRLPPPHPVGPLWRRSNLKEVKRSDWMNCEANWKPFWLLLYEWYLGSQMLLFLLVFLAFLLLS